MNMGSFVAYLNIKYAFGIDLDLSFSTDSKAPKRNRYCNKMFDEIVLYIQTLLWVLSQHRFYSPKTEIDMQQNSPKLLDDKKEVLLHIWKLEVIFGDFRSVPISRPQVRNRCATKTFDSKSGSLYFMEPNSRSLVQMEPKLYYWSKQMHPELCIVINVQLEKSTVSCDHLGFYNGAYNGSGLLYK